VKNASVQGSRRPERRGPAAIGLTRSTEFSDIGWPRHRCGPSLERCGHSADPVGESGLPGLPRAGGPRARSGGTRS